MIEYLLTFIGIYFLCLFKFIAGPTLGAAVGYSLMEIEIVTVSGMMTSVIAFTYLGEWIKHTWVIKIRKNQRRFTKRTRNIVKVWRKFGVWGIATLTPILFTPIGGTIIMTSFGISKKRILTSMLISAIFWAFVFGISIHKILEFPVFTRLAGL
ncbi:hypothetical protein [Pleomorphovibrio marinus]|uniref:hypothetical protein n=1 Tax=Pleomorphovibrio marinus TaxID=2164132 RepID=UPI0018E55E37|nr:hypothetical protein [Pleomorphovibrio marinus]